MIVDILKNAPIPKNMKAALLHVAGNNSSSQADPD